MERVQCVKCNDVGYTSSPLEVICRCGGRLVKMPCVNGWKMVISKKIMRKQ